MSGVAWMMRQGQVETGARCLCLSRCGRRMLCNASAASISPPWRCDAWIPCDILLYFEDTTSQSCKTYEFPSNYAPGSPCHAKPYAAPYTRVAVAHTAIASTYLQHRFDDEHLSPPSTACILSRPPLSPCARPLAKKYPLVEGSHDWFKKKK